MSYKKMQMLAAKSGADGKHLRATDSKMLLPRCTLFIWEAIPGRAMKEWERERGKGGPPITGVSMSRLPVWATGAQSQWRPLGDGVKHILELSCEWGRKLGHVSTLPISQWLKMVPPTLRPFLVACCIPSTPALRRDADAGGWKPSACAELSSKLQAVLWGELRGNSGPWHWPGNSGEGGKGEEATKPTLTKFNSI